MFEKIINRPVVVIVAMILLAIFGILAAKSMPYQLTPKVVRPVVAVFTTWSGASPYEIEREIVERQEQALKGLDNLVSLESNSRTGRASVGLEFEIGTDLTKAVLDVSNKLNEVKGYPDSMDRPQIRATGDESSPTVRLLLVSEDPSVNIRHFRTFFNEHIIQYFERIAGVAEVFFPSGDDRQMHIMLDFHKLAAYGLTIDSIINALEKENVNISAGTLHYGRKSYRVRTNAEFKSSEQIANMIIWSDGQRRVRMRDIASVKEGYATKVAATMYNGKEALNIMIKPSADANILELTNEIEKVFNELNSGILANEGVKLEWMSDQRGYILQAISLVKQNVLIGAILAVLVLFLFLRSFSSTIIIALSMPLSIFGTFIILAAFGRSLNVVSLAGISFAVGMLVDSAIVVLENIHRHKNLGKSLDKAVFDGSREVFGGLVASVLTTIAIFIPILQIKREAGQLFSDIALAASSAVGFSLFVSLFVIPALCKFIWSKSPKQIQSQIESKSIESKNTLKNIGVKIASFFDLLGEKYRVFVMRFVEISLKNKKNKILTISSLVVFCLFLFFALFPKMEYLPQGNQNFILAILNPPPASSFEQRVKAGEELFACLAPYFADKEISKSQNKIDLIESKNEKDSIESSEFKNQKDSIKSTQNTQKPNFSNLPKIDNMFFLGHDSFTQFGLRAAQSDRAAELIPLARYCISTLPSFAGSVSQQGIFERSMGQGRSIDVNVSGAEINSIIKTAIALQSAVLEHFGAGVQVRAIPSLEILQPELNLYPNKERIAALGFSSASFGIMLDTLLDGRKIAEYKEEGREKIDLILRSIDEQITSPESLSFTSIYTPQGRIVPLESLANLRLEYGIDRILHTERDRAFILRISPPKNITIEEAMEIIQNKITPKLRADGLLNDNKLKFSGSANDLIKVRTELISGFLLAVLIVYLLMSALYENFIYPLLILFSVPLSLGGGVLGLWLTDKLIAPQALDILTMLGFIILVGIVVNNAILIVHQALHNVRKYGLKAEEAIKEAVRVRFKPIYMSTLTSLFGMLPLVLAPGAGSEIYRGLGAVILGGLALSTILTIFVIPCLLSFFITREKPAKIASSGDLIESSKIDSI